jgi:hypothetical protein
MYKIPSKKTLDKYGLSEEEWEVIFHSQGDKCPICGNESKTGRYVTDHFHIKGWRNMPPEQRKLYVRGITCWWCNKQIIGRGVTVQKLQNAIDYILEFDNKLWLK